METKVKTQKTIQDVEQEVLAYLNQTSKHLFITENQFFYKVIPAKINDEWFCITIRFNGEKCYTSIQNVNRMITNHGTNTKNVMKECLFPQHYGKKTSIPNFKLMRQKTLSIINSTQVWAGNENAMKTCVTDLLNGVNYNPKVQE